MLEYLKEEQNKTTTTNGCGAYNSTNSKVLDLFSSAGAMRNRYDDYIKTKFSLAYNEDPLLALKCLFFARDIREGLGERRVFRLSIDWLVANAPDVVKKNFSNFAEFGRFDDLIRLVDSEIGVDVVHYISDILYNDIQCLVDNKNPSLLAKWMPSENTSSKSSRELARKIIKIIGVTPKAYRKTIAKLRQKIGIIENNLRERDYTFDYSKQPSKAMMKYRSAFIRNDYERYKKYLDDVAKGKVKINTSTLCPVDIVTKCYDENLCADSTSVKALDVTWKNLVDDTTDEDAIVVVDGSGSMYSYQKPVPAYVAQALGLYFAERNKGRFKNHFITFSSKPKLVEVPSSLNIVEKVKYISKFNDCSNTNIEKTFDLILDVAVKNNLPQNEIPKRMYIISDMQFDRVFDFWGTSSYETAFSNAKNKFKNAGYEIPEVVFWNVNDYGNVPVTMNEEGVALVSGYSSKIFGMVTTNNLNPYQLMLDILNSERYNKIVN